MTRTSRYVLRSRWRLPLDVAAAWDVVESLLSSPDPFVWWDAVTVQDRADDRLRVVTRSHAGYVLRFELHDLDVRRPDRVTVRAVGDLDGHGTIRVRPDGAGSVIDVDWQVETTRAWMRRTAPVMRPVFVAAHAMVMRQGRRAFVRWLAPQQPVDGWE